jgi:hypothetical protein
MKMFEIRAHDAPMMTNSIPTNPMRRPPRFDSQGKRQPPSNRRAFDPVAYAAALEVLG